MIGMVGAVGKLCDANHDSSCAAVTRSATGAYATNNHTFAKTISVGSVEMA